MSNLDAIVEIWCVFSTESFSGVRFAVCFEMQYRDFARDWSRLSKFGLLSVRRIRWKIHVQWWQVVFWWQEAL